MMKNCETQPSYSSEAEQPYLPLIVVRRLFVLPGDTSSNLHYMMFYTMQPYIFCEDMILAMCNHIPMIIITL